jgi:hypothetical protein
MDPSQEASNWVMLDFCRKRLSFWKMRPDTQRQIRGLRHSRMSDKGGATPKSYEAKESPTSHKAHLLDPRIIDTMHFS